MVETTSTLDQLVAMQEWEQALQLVTATRITLPAQPDLAVWQVVLNEQLGRGEAASAALAEAETLLAATPAHTWITLGTKRLQVGDIEGAEQAAETARSIAPDEAQVYFLLGGIAETRGDITAAIDYFDQTFTLAESTSPQLAVIARASAWGNCSKAPALSRQLNRSQPLPPKCLVCIRGPGGICGRWASISWAACC